MWKFLRFSIAFWVLKYLWLIIAVKASIRYRRCSWKPGMTTKVIKNHWADADSIIAICKRKLYKGFPQAELAKNGKQFFTALPSASTKPRFFFHFSRYRLWYQSEINDRWQRPTRALIARSEVAGGVFMKWNEALKESFHVIEVAFYVQIRSWSKLDVRRWFREKSRRGWTFKGRDFKETTVHCYRRLNDLFEWLLKTNKITVDVDHKVVGEYCDFDGD